MIIYLIKSIICMGILYMFYHWVLADIAIHRFKRGYLLFAAVFALIVPILPTGYTINLAQTTNATELINLVPTQTEVMTVADPINWSWMRDIALSLSIMISLILLLNVLRGIYLLLRKARVNHHKPYHGMQIVLLEEDIVPHTFLDNIYINAGDYEEGRIDDQLLAHEMAHARQRHSWDVIFIEILINIFWFNPLLRMYKTAIQLNHEFLADEAVLTQYQEVKNYQYLLLEIMNNNKPISLASSINFHLTKKRLKMMTTKSTALQRALLPWSILPLTVLLLVSLGSPVTAQVTTKTMEATNERSQENDRDRYYKETIVHYTDKDGRAMVQHYKDLPEGIKNQMAPPPPLPPPPPGATRDYDNAVPLKKGTKVTIKGNGAMMIGAGSNVPPPPPPPVPAAIAASPVPPPPPPIIEGNIAPPPPPVEPAPPAPPVDMTSSNALRPPPPPPTTIRELVEQGADVYLNGKLLDPSVAKDFSEDTDSKNMIYKTDKSGKVSLYITKKD